MPIPQFTIPVFGRREHFELILRVWFVRDVRSIYSIQFPRRGRTIDIHFLSPQLLPTRSNISLTRRHRDVNISWSTILQDGQQWWTQQAMEDANLPFFPVESATTQRTHPTYDVMKFPFELPIFANPVLKLSVPHYILHKTSYSKSLSKAQQLQQLQLRQTTQGVERTGDPNLVNKKEHNNTNEKENNLDNGFVHLIDDTVDFTAVFSPPFVSSDFFNVPFDREWNNAASATLSICHFVPTLPSNHSLDTSPLDLPYEPSEQSARSFFSECSTQASIVTSSPMCIIPIDLCDEASINIAIWAYHQILYLWNHHCPFPQPRTKIVVMVFNRAALDMHIISERQIHDWFDQHPLEVEFVSYNSPFILPSETDLDEKVRIISTLCQPTHASLSSSTTLPSTTLPPTPLPPTTLSSATANGGVSSSILPLPTSRRPPRTTVSPLFTFDPHYLEQERANIELATQLDVICISQLQQDDYIESMFLKNALKTSAQRTPHTILPPPRPFIQSAIQYPFRSMIGKPIKLGIKLDGRTLPFFVPDQMKHWCCFDPSHQNPIHSFDRSKQVGKLQTPVDTAAATTVATSTTVSALNPNIILNAHESRKIAATFPPTFESVDPSSYDTRPSRHHCTQLGLQFFPFNPLRQHILEDSIWTPKRIFDEIGTDSFHLLTMCHSLSPNKHPSFSSPSSLAPLTYQTAPTTTATTAVTVTTTAKTDSNNKIHYIVQKPQYSPLPSITGGEIQLPLNFSNNMIIEHYSTPSVVPIHHYVTNYKDYYPNQLDELQLSPPPPSSSPSVCLTPTVAPISSHRLSDSHNDIPNNIPNKEKEKAQTQFSSVPISPQLPLTTTIHCSYTRPDRYYSTMYIDHDFKFNLPSGQPPDISPLLSTYPQQASQSLSQLFTSTNAISTDTTPITSLSLPHHFAIQCGPSPELSKPIFTPIPLHLPYQHLFTYTVVDLAVFEVSINVIQLIRQCSFENSSSFDFFRRKPVPKLRYTTKHTINAHNNQNCNQQPPQHSQPLLSKTEIHTIHACTLDLPTTKAIEAIVYAGIDHPIYINYPPKCRLFHEVLKIYYTHVNHASQINAFDRGVVPHFIIIVDDGKDHENPIKLSTMSDIEASRPAFLSKEAAMMQTYLSQCVPIAAGSNGQGFPLHYAFIPCEQLKNTLLNCIHTAIAMRLDHCNF